MMMEPQKYGKGNNELTLNVTPAQHMDIMKLSLECEYEMVFDDRKWIEGLKKICGNKVIDDLMYLNFNKPVKLIVKEQ
jgi:hypothetical protein